MANDIVAQAADGTQHVFPAGTDVSIIDAAMKRYVSMSQPGAMQSKPGGPIFNARTATPSSDTGLTPGGAAREAALGAFSGLGIPETQTPVTDFGKNLMETIGTMFGGKSWQGQDPSGKEALKANPIVSVPTALASGFGNAVDAINPVIDNLFRALTPGMKPRQFDAGKSIHDITSFGTQVGTLKAAKEVPEAISDPFMGKRLASMGREVMGEGASKANVLGDLHAHAIETQKHIAGVRDLVHTDAQDAMARVSQAVDAAKPEGAFDKSEVRGRLTNAMGDILEDQSQLPSSLKKLTTPEKPSFATMLNKNTADFVNRLKQGGMANDEIAQALKEQGFQANEIKAALGESGPEAGRMTFEEVKQARSDLGRQLGRLQGPAKAAADASYGELSKILREGARDAQVEPDWIEANARYKNYVDDFIRSPLSKALEGENATDIMDPLTGKSRAQVMGILGKYAPFGMDMERIGQEVNRSGMGETVMKLSRPSKMDLLLARLSPSAVALRQAGPRIFRNPKVISAIAGEGFESKPIAPSQVFPSKSAAMKAAKGGSIPQGNPTPFGSGGINAKGVEESMRPTSTARAIQSLSSEIDTMKTKLRNATGASQSEKAALAKQISDYQTRLDELRDE